MKHYFSIFILAMCLASGIASGAVAQDTKDQQIEKFVAKVREYRMIKLIDRLKLTEEQSIRFFPRFNKYQDEQAANMLKGRQFFEDLDKMKVSNATDADIEKKILQVLEVQKASGEILSRHIKDFKDVLSMRQIAELVIFERDFTRDIGRLVNEAQKKPKVE
jgi:hypothetical protein